MTDHLGPPPSGYRQQILETLTPVRPLLPPSRRVWMLAPLGVLLAVSAPLLNGQRGDLGLYAPLVTWGASALQALVGLWLLALAFREAVPGRNVSAPALIIAATLTGVVVAAVTLVTNDLSATFVRPGYEWQYWAECVVGPMTIGAPFMILSTLMAGRAFPTRPAIAGALCGMAAGVLADAGWRLSCWISAPGHVIGSHGIAIVAMATAGALLSVLADRGRWTRLESRQPFRREPRR